MRAYEYIRLRLDMGDLSELNRFSLDGWHVTAIVPDAAFSYWVLLERPAGDVGDSPDQLGIPSSEETKEKES